MAKKKPKFRVRMVDEKANLFVPDYRRLAPIKVIEINAESEEQVREFFKEAKKKNFPSVRGMRLISVEETKNAGKDLS